MLKYWNAFKALPRWQRLAIASGAILALTWIAARDWSPPALSVVRPIATPALPTTALTKTADPKDAALAEFSVAEKDAVKLLQKLFDDHDYLGTLKLADELLTQSAALPHLTSWIWAQLPAMVVSASWQALQKDDCPMAILLFKRAEGLGRSPLIDKGLGYCYAKVGDAFASVLALEAYLKTTKSDIAMSDLLIEQYESSHRFQDAADLLDHRIKNSNALTAAEMRKLRERLYALRAREKESAYQENASSRHFTLTYRAVEHEALAQAALSALEIAYEELVRDFGLSETQAPIEVVFYPETYFKNVVAGGPAWAEGVFDGRMRIPVTAGGTGKAESVPGQPLWLTIAKHELVHAMLAHHVGFRAIPAWFDEGFAQLFGCGNSCPPFAFDATPGEFLPPDVFSQRYTNLDRIRAGRAYSQSHYLLLTLGRWGEQNQLPTRELITQMLKGLKGQTVVTSDSLLLPLNLTFTQLHDYAAKLWKQRAALKGH